MNPKRPHAKSREVVAVRYEVIEGTHFPKVLGQFDPAEARALVAVNPHARHMHPTEWAYADEVGPQA